MKSALITGGNKGIGFEIAKQLMGIGYYVYIGSREPAKGIEAIEKLKSLGFSNTDWLKLDVTDIDSIQAARQELEGRIENLDILINNAGIRGEVPQPASKIPMERIRQVFETNFFGAIQVTQTMMGLLKKSDQPRIVNVTSDLASLTNHSDPTWEFYPFKSTAYCCSKTALNAYTVMLAFELKETNFKVNCVNPGHTATDFNNFKGKKPVEQGARVIVKYATLDENGPTGNYFSEEGVTPW